MPFHVAVSPDGAHAYAADNQTGPPGLLAQISVINTATDTGSGTISAPNGPGTIVTYGHPAPPPPPPSISVSTSLPAAIQNVLYWRNLMPSGGISPYTVSLASGSLPSGLTLMANGIITGTPTSTATTSTFAVLVTDSNYPPDTTTATMTLTVQPASTTPPPCGGLASAGWLPPPPPPLNCASGSNTVPSRTATATSTGTAGHVTVTAHGTGGLTVGQYALPPSGGVSFRATNFFDLALSSSNTFTSITVVDCALGGATSLMWFNPAANAGAGAYLPVNPETYNAGTHCVTATFSSISSPPISALNGTIFGGALPAETVSLTKGGPSPYSVSGSVVSGAVTITPGPLLTKVSGTVMVSGSGGQPVTFTISATCVFGVCAGTFSVSDPGAGVNFTTPLTVTAGTVNANRAGGQGLVLPGPGLKNAYPLSWNVTVSSS